MISRKVAVFAIILPLCIPLLTTGIDIIQGPDFPQGISIEPPEEHDRVSDAVLMIVLDGLPAYVMDDPEYMPSLASWTDYGAKAVVSTSEITLTGPCTKEMSTGIHASPIDAMRNWAVTYDGKDDAYHYALERNMSVAFTGFYVWTNLFTDERFVHETVYDAGFSDIYIADDKIISNVEDWIITQEHDLMIAHLGGTDHAGHMFGTKAEKYKDKMRHLDAQLNSIRNSLPSGWTLLITADHGMSESGGHAISTGDLAMKVNLLMYGEGVETGATAEISQRDIASIPLTLLDLPFPISADSIIPLDLFDFNDSLKQDLEQWNWEAQRERQAWLEENGYPFSELDEVIDWSKLPELTQQPSTLDILTSFIPLLGLAFITYNNRGDEKVVQDNTIPIVAVSVGFCALIWVHYMWFYEIDLVVWTTKWIRKMVGIFSIMIVTGAIFYMMFINNHKERKWNPNVPSWSPYLLIAAVLWQPDSRLSPSMLIFGIFLVTYLVKFAGKQKNKLNSYVFLIIVLLPLWTIINYYIGLIINLSIYELTGIDFFYKFWQQIIMTFTTQNLLPAIILATLGSFVADRIFFKENNFEWLKLALPIYCVIGLHYIGNSWVDRVILIWIAFIVTQMVMTRIKHPMSIDSPFRAKWSELFALSMIIPTWGVWPAIITLLLVRSIPVFVEDNLQWLNQQQENGLSESCRKIVLAMIPWFLLCTIWTHYSLLTPMGLIEFNPSKIIVTGGFFGARTDPPIIWMATMISLPLVISCTMTVNAWSKSGFDLFPTIILSLYLIATNVSIMWMVLITPQVLLMIGFSSTVFIFWFVCLIFGQTTMTSILKGEGMDLPRHADLKN